jgi:hypothetical protein
MNKLTFETTTLNTLSFILKVDGKPMLDARKTDEDEIPAWICEEGIPSFPPMTSGADRVIVGVCGCGEYGCGHTSARIERRDGVVRLFDFQGAGIPTGAFEFSQAEFDEVSAQIALIAKVQIAKWQEEFK